MRDVVTAGVCLAVILAVLNYFGLIGNQAPMLFTDCSNAWSPALQSRCAADGTSFAGR